jgi:hypothetical protein
MTAVDFELVSSEADLLGELPTRLALFVLGAALYHGAHLGLWFERASTAAGRTDAWRVIRDAITDENARIEQAENAVLLLGDLARRQGNNEAEALGVLRLALQQDALAQSTVRVLSTIQTEGALALLEESLQRKEVAGQVIDRLGEVRTAASVEILTRALKRNDLAGRAAQALDGIAKGRPGEVTSLAQKALARRRRPAQPRDAGQSPARGWVEPLADPATLLHFTEWETLLRRIQHGRCVPVLGPGLALAAGFSPRDFARQLISQFDFPLPDDTDLYRVAQFVSTVTQDAVLVKERIAKAIRPTSMPHADWYRMLAALPLPLYITTNYDDNLVQALLSQGRDATMAVYPWNRYLRRERSVFEPGFIPTVERPLVYHLHGHLSKVESIVVTEDDIIDFLLSIARDENSLPPTILEMLARGSNLFLGFSSSDWFFRALLRALFVDRAEARVSRQSYLVATAPSDGTQWISYLEKYYRQENIELYWGTAPEFLQELHRRWEATSFP